MLVHLRLTVPDDLTDGVREVLTGHDWITNVTVQPGACVQPPGDLVECDVAKEKANEVLGELDDLGVCDRGGILVTQPTGTPFRAANELEAAAPGHPDDAIIWESVEEQAEDGAVGTVSFQIFLVIAVSLGAIAVINDSAVLVVGAMVVGPEFSAIAAASAGVVLARWGLVGRSLRLLLVSFAFSIAVVTLCALLARPFGLVTVEMVTRPRPNTGFIWHPDWWSFVVALLAGVAGALALSVEKTATMVGVFISVTTVPAAGNLALGLALWQRAEIVGSIEQLVLNVATMVVAGALLLAAQRAWWPWLVTHSERYLGQRSGAR